VAAPSDLEQVQQAFRLGWTLAEIRGRYRPDVQHVGPPPRGRRIDNALPLGDERSEREQEIELHKTLASLSKTLKLDPALAQPSLPQVKANVCDQVDGLGERMADALKLARAPNAGDDARQGARTEWHRLTETLYIWDKFIQDELIMQPSRAAAYQLGRALAETYWALDPTVLDDEDWRSWRFVLGDRRCRRIKQLTGRLSGYLDPLTPAAVNASVDAWAEVAKDTRWRSQTDARQNLYNQGLIWRDLVRGEQRPGDLTQSRGGLIQLGLLPHVLRGFWLELLLGLGATAILAIGATALSAGTKQEATSTLWVILGGFGITAASLFAKAKASANSLIAQLRQMVGRERIAQAATCRPSKPSRVALPTANSTDAGNSPGVTSQ
jgi:hypothetical protein